LPYSMPVHQMHSFTMAAKRRDFAGVNGDCKGMAAHSPSAESEAGSAKTRPVQRYMKPWSRVWLQWRWEKPLGNAERTRGQGGPSGAPSGKAAQAQPSGRLSGSDEAREAFEGAIRTFPLCRLPRQYPKVAPARSSHWHSDLATCAPCTSY